MRSAKAYTTSRNVPTHAQRNPQDISPKEAEKAYRRYVIERSSVDIPDMVIRASKGYNYFGMTKYQLTVRITDSTGVTVDKFEVPFVRLSKNNIQVFIEGENNE